MTCTVLLLMLNNNFIEKGKTKSYSKLLAFELFRAAGLQRKEDK